MQRQSSIILASTSPYRKLMLERFSLPFETAAPEVDESEKPGETPRQMVRRLAREKAEAVAAAHPSALVIGSDQVAECEGAWVGKPGSEARARMQLAGFSGRTVRFLSAFAIVSRDNAFVYERTVITEVIFRRLESREIERYVALDQPLDCAGSFRSEASGPALLEAMRSDDPTAIMGLPLIELTKGLRAGGVRLP
ncbi:MAG: septum formation protein Maf [Gammaproteobacteria bacterium]|nr:septum formation protein Maf [Gammaproteobacteria bacterium]MBT8052145.1 septum formation protein Maf [Gammaproteobacteria bacterium]